jgi:hypothetical protein
MRELRFFNPYGDIRHTENRLPHWQQEGAVYFITFRLADAVPSRLRIQWEGERGALSKPPVFKCGFGAAHSSQTAVCKPPLLDAS